MKNLTEGSVTRQIISFTVPMLIGNVFQQSYNIVDSIIVGQAIGKSALAAVGASFPVIFLLVSLIMGITMGFTILIAQYFGANDFTRVKRTVDTSVIFLLIATAVITVGGLLSSRFILVLLNTPSDILPQAVVFLRIIFAGMIFMLGYNTISAILRGLGDSKTPLYFLIVSTVLNAGLVIFFVYVLKMGIAGSAYATVIAQGVSFIAGVIYINMNHSVLKFRLTSLIFDREIFSRSLAIGLPSGLQQMFVAGGMMALTRIVNGFGTNAIAAFTAAGRLDTFAMMPAMNLSVALSTFVGQNVGAQKLHRVRQGLLVSIAIGCAISVFIGAGVLLFGDPLMRLFSHDQKVITIGVNYLLIVGGFYPVFSTMFVFGGALRGAGDALIPMIVTICSLWGIRIPLSTVLSRYMGTTGIWWGIPIAWSVGLLAMILYYSSGRWKSKIKKIPPPLTPSPEDDESEFNCSAF